MKSKLLATLVLLFGISSLEVFAQYTSFGKNRVQYQDFEWRYIQSKHFDVYYYGEKNYELAEFAAQSVESAYSQLKIDFQHEIVNRISVIIYDSHNDFSQTNVVTLPIDAESIGGVTDKMKNRMTIPFAGDYNDFRRTIHHELVHAVFNDMFYGGSIQSIIRNNIQLIFPLWFEEGLAEYMALGWDTNTDMFIRDAVINGYLGPIPYLNGYYAYRGGQSVWNYIAEEYGREKIAEILGRIKTSRSVEFGFNDALGLTTEELSEQWEQALKERYFPEVAERENAKAVATQMTKRGQYGTYNTSPAISPQGDKIAFITNKRGYFDVIVVDALNGKKLKTLIRGEDDPEFEELNVLNPNLTWSPDGQKLAFSAKTRGFDDIAIVDYRSGKINKIKFPEMDAIGSVAWSPDGSKLAFDGNIGPYQDIFVYDFQTEETTNLTSDFFSDYQPSWSNDSDKIFFTSDRGDKVELDTYKTEFKLLADTSIYQSDIYSAGIGSSVAERITATPGWNEKQPLMTSSGVLIFNSDQNGIQNIYEYNFETGTASALTDLQAGISQMSLSRDGSRVALSMINEGYLDVFLLKSPTIRRKTEPLKPNYWANRRAKEPLRERVPAIMMAKDMYESGIISGSDRAEQEEQEKLAKAEAEPEKENSGEIDFRNYVFSDDVIADSTIELKDEFLFEPSDNVTNDGRFVPRPYRLKFSTDIAYSPTVIASTYGTYALVQFIVSDLLGDHQLSLGTNFQTDLRNSDYSVEYGYLKNRTNLYFSYFHSSRQYQTFGGDLLRFRTFGGGINIQYPFDKFKRIDLSTSYISLIRDYDKTFTLWSSPTLTNQSTSINSSFLYHTVTFTRDATLPGLITPRGGNRISLELSGSPQVGKDAPLFISLMGDMRKYFNLGRNYTFALRGSGGASLGPDSQTYFLGGMLGWINQRWSDNGIPFERLTDTFFTMPAVPLRGHRFNEIYGSRFGLINAEFRFPLFAALIPGAVPILPFYNITGAAFVDVGTAWGYDITQSIRNPITGQIIDINQNPKELDFRLGQTETLYYDLDPAVNGFVDAPGPTTQEFSYVDGDILAGAGFGLRTIVLGLPFRYDVAWPYTRGGFDGKPIHYFSVGIDF